MLQIMLEALRIGHRLSFKVCYHVNGLRHETSFPFPKRLLSRTYLIQDPVTAFCNCLFVCFFCFLFIYFLAESDRKQKFDVKSRKYSIVLKARGQNLTHKMIHIERLICASVL